MMTDKDQQHTRVNKALLSKLERSSLNWFAKRMPVWVTPDKLTILGFLGTILIGVSYYLTNQNPAFLWLANLGLVINWFGDSLDGTLARFRRIERPRYGFFIDHTIDGLGEVIIMVGIGLSPYLDFRIAMLALVGYLLLGNLVYITTYIRNEFRISYAGLSPTEVRLILILANVLVFFLGNTKIQTGLGLYSVYDYIIIALIVLLFGIYLWMMYTHATQLVKEEEEARQQ
jgi:phosphatidylglycerophosphate synthase